MRGTCTPDRRGSSFRRVALATILIAAGLAVGLAAGPAAAQSLDLPGALRAPEIDPPTASDALAERLEAEILRLAEADRRARDGARILLRCSINLRVVARSLLEATAGAEESSTDAAIARLAALRIADARHDLDAMLERLAAAPFAREAVLGAQTFNDAVVDHAESIAAAAVDAALLDALLARVFAPLRDLAERLAAEEDAPPHAPDPWPAAAAIDGVGATSSAPRDDRSLADRIGAAPLEEATKATLLEASAFLDRGARFPEFAARIAAGRRAIERALAFAAALEAAGWLPEETVAAYRARLARAVELHRDPATRALGDAWLARLAASTSAIGRIGSFEARRAVRGPLLEALVFVDALEVPLPERGAPDPPSTHLLDRLGVLLDRMAAFRALEADLNAVPLPRDLMRTRAGLTDAYAATERSLLEAIPAITRDPSALSDPAFQSLVVAQAELLRRIEQMNAMPEWLEEMTAIDPGAGRRVESLLRRWTGWTLDPVRREDAGRDLDALARRAEAWLPELPFESALDRAEPVARTASGGLHRELRAAVLVARREWVESLGVEGAPEAPTLRLERLGRLLGAMADAAPLLGAGEDVAVLRRWGAWSLPAALIARAGADLPNRLRIATRAALDGNDRDLDRQLAALERDAPFARLVGRLAARLGSVLVGDADAARTALAILATPPRADAWALGERGELARLCRWTLEADVLLQAERRDEAERAAAWADHLARSLVDRLVAAPGAGR